MCQVWCAEGEQGFCCRAEGVGAEKVMNGNKVEEMRQRTGLGWGGEKM